MKYGMDTFRQQLRYLVYNNSTFFVRNELCSVDHAFSLLLLLCPLTPITAKPPTAVYEVTRTLPATVRDSRSGALTLAHTSHSGWGVATAAPSIAAATTAMESLVERTIVLVTRRKWLCWLAGVWNTGRAYGLVGCGGGHKVE